MTSGVLSTCNLGMFLSSTMKPEKCYQHSPYESRITVSICLYRGGRGSNFWVAVSCTDDDLVVGCVGALENKSDTSEIELTRLSVSAAVQKQGIAR